MKKSIKWPKKWIEMSPFNNDRDERYAQVFFPGKEGCRDNFELI
jgi:hypothetical protein